MLIKEVFDRRNSIQMDLPKSIGKIEELTIIDDQLLAFGTHAIYKIQTSEYLDSNLSAPDSRHTYVELFPVGAKSTIIARTVIQFQRILSSVIFKNEININQLKTKIWLIAQKLISCDRIVSRILTESKKLIYECDEIIERHKNLPVIPGLPQVADLDSHVRQFFLEAKRVLIEVFKLINIFYPRTKDNWQETNFDKHVQWIKDHLVKDHEMFLKLDEDMLWIKLLVDCRNAIEHPRKGYSVSIYNFGICPGNKFSSPSWKYDLSDIGRGQIDEAQLIQDLEKILNNLVTFFEEIILLCIKDNFSEIVPFKFFKYPKINEECPVLYGLTIDKK